MWLDFGTTDKNDGFKHEEILDLPTARMQDNLVLYSMHLGRDMSKKRHPC
jgi:hypothetical protein